MSNKSIYCNFCENTGIVRNPYFEQVGEAPLQPCPKCVIPKCKCDGHAPYYYAEDGKIVDCFCKDVRLKINKINDVYKNSGIEKKYKWRFLNEYQSVNQLTNKAKSLAYEIISEFPNVDKGLFLYGNAGTGKTLLASIILTELITRQAVAGRYVKVSKLFNQLKATFNPSSPTYGNSAKIEQELKTVDILVLDDFGVQKDTEWGLETLYNLVDSRYEAEKFTIFTSNYDPRVSLRDVSEGRILSRLKEMCHLVEISGSDYRDTL